MNAKRKSIGAVGMLLALVSLLVFVAACSGDGGDADPTATEPAVLEPTDEPAATEPAAETTIDVSLTEFAVDSSVGTAPVGTVTFSVANDGAILHNLKVVATDLDADALPVDDDAFAVDEDQVDIRVASGDLAAGDAEDLTVELEAGSYVLICNVATHYETGMTIGFVVE